MKLVEELEQAAYYLEQEGTSAGGPGLHDDVLLKCATALRARAEHVRECLREWHDIVYVFPMDDESVPTLNALELLAGPLPPRG